MAAEEIVSILKIEVDNDSAADALAKTEQELERLRKEQKQYRKELKESNGENKEAAENLVRVQKELRENTKERRSLIKEIDAEGKTLETLRARQTRLIKQRNELNLTTAEAREEFDKLNETILQYNEVIKQAEEEGGNFGRNVGNYKQDISEALEAFESAPAGIGGFIKGIKGIGVAIAANPIGLLITGITTLIGLFNQTETGSRVLRRVLAVLEGAFGILTSIIDDAAQAIGDLFSDEADKGLVGFGESLKTYVIDRLTTGLKALQGFGRAFEALISGKFEKAGDEAAAAAKDLLEFSLGFDIIGKAVEKGALITLADQLEQTKQGFRDIQNELEVNIAQLQARQQLLAGIAGDSTLALEEQRKANLAVLEASEQAAASELSLSRQRLEIANQELELVRQSGKIQDEALEAQKNARIELIQAEADFTEAQRANAQERRQILQDIGEFDLDVLIDGFDNQKTINERRIANDELSIEARRKLAEENEQFANESFERQIEVLQQFTDKRIDANALVQESNAVLLAEELKNSGLSEILNTRLLEVVRERRTVLQDLAETQKELEEGSIERTERSLEAGRELLQLQTEQQLKQAESIEERKEAEEALIELENDRLARLLENEKLTAEERELIAFESEQKIQSIRDNSVSEQIKTQKELAKTEESIQSAKLNAQSSILGDALELTKAFGIESNALTISLGLADVGVNLAKNLSANSLAAANLTASIPGPVGVGLGIAYQIASNALAISTAGLASKEILSNQITAAGGGTFVTNGLTSLVVGDNPGGKELVQVTPLSGKGRTTTSGNVISMAGGGTVVADGGTGTNSSRASVASEMFTSRQLSKMISNMPAPIVGVREFARVQDSISVKEKTARIGQSS